MSEASAQRDIVACTAKGTDGEVRFGIVLTLSSRPVAAPHRRNFRHSGQSASGGLLSCLIKCLCWDILQWRGFGAWRVCAVRALLSGPA